MDQPAGDYARRFMKNGMEQKGYRLVSENELPLAARREESDLSSDTPWTRGYGVAGSIGEP